MDKVRYGVIGLGNQGSYYINSLFGGGKIENAVVTAVCDINPDKIDAIEKAGNALGSAAFSDYREMLGSGLVDAVLVETPHYLHPEMVIECLKRGIHVICDKPAGVYAKQVRLMNEESEKSGALFCMMFNQRTNSLYIKMREMIKSGAIGKLNRVTWKITDWFRTQTYYNSGSWRATWAGEGGGVLINQCPHQLDLVSWIVGENPQKVTAFCGYGKWHDIEVEDEVTAYFEYANGATGVFITTTGEWPGTNRLEISGTKGKLVCESGKLEFFKNSVDSEECLKTSDKSFAFPPVEKISVETDNSNPQHEGVINAFTEAIIKGLPSPVDGREGINGVMLMNAIELSGWLNKTVTLPVDEELYLSELNKRVATSRLKTNVKEVAADTDGSFGSEVK